MSDLRRQLNTARTQAETYKRERDALSAILGDIDPAYAAAYADLCDLALNGHHQEHAGSCRQHPQSRPPRYHPAAYHYRNEERRDQRHRATRIRALVEALTDDNQLTLKELAK